MCIHSERGNHRPAALHRSLHFIRGRTRVLDAEWENTFRRWYPHFRPRAQAKKAACGWDSILLGSLPLEKPARLGVKGQSERSLLPEPLQKWKSMPPDPRWYDPFLPDVRPDMPVPRQ